MSNFTDENNKLIDKAIKDIAERVNANLATIQKGDTVQLVYCYEAVKYHGQPFKVLSDPVKQGLYWVVELEHLGLFHLGFIKKIKMEEK